MQALDFGTCARYREATYMYIWKMSSTKVPCSCQLCRSKSVTRHVHRKHAGFYSASIVKVTTGEAASNLVSTSPALSIHTKKVRGRIYVIYRRYRRCN